VVRLNRPIPSSFFSVATILDAVGCESPNSRLAREKLPVRAARTNSLSAVRFSLAFDGVVGIGAHHSSEVCREGSGMR
jgi:hypothetical protein